MLAQLAGLGLAIGGSLFGMNEAENAADRARQAAMAAGEIQKDYLSHAIDARRTGTANAIGYLQQLSPFANTGVAAQRTLADALGLNGIDAQRAYFSSFQTDPGYMATVKGGTDAIEHSQSGSGLLRSGGTLKSLYDYGQKSLYGQISDRLNRIAGLGASGQQAATTMATGSAGIEDASANAIAGFTRDMGIAKAGGLINASNADQRGTQNMLAMLGYGMGQARSPINDLAGQFGKFAFGMA